MKQFSLTEQTIALQNGRSVPVLQAELAEGDSKSSNWMQLFPMLAEGDNAFSLFLHTLPSIADNDLLPYLEKAVLNLTLSFTLLPPAGDGNSIAWRINTKVALYVLENGYRTPIAEAVGGGDQLLLRATIPVRYAADVLHAIRGAASGIVVETTSKVYFNGSDRVRKFVSTTELEALFSSQLPEKPKTSVELNYLYFDQASNQYLPLPKKLLTNNSRSLAVAANTAVLSGKNLLSTQLAVNPFNQQSTMLLANSWILSPDTILQNFPIVDNPNTGYWVNRKNAQELLALPDLQTVDPAPNDQPSTASFRFFFRQTGLNDSNGKPVLEGECRLTVKQIISAATQAAANAAFPGLKISPVALNGCTYSLVIPYADAEGNAKEMLVATTSVTAIDNGSATLLFRMNNGSVRLCYAALSAANDGKTTPIRLVANMSYYGYVPVSPIQFNALDLIGNKLSAIPVIRKNGMPKNGEAYFDATHRKLVSGNGEDIAYRDSQHANHTTRAPLLATSIRLNNNLHLQPAVLAPVKWQVIDRIDLSTWYPLKKKKYRQQVFAKEKSIDLSYPCTQFGSFYQEENAGVFSPVGCMQAYKLGEPPISLYTELADLRNDRRKLYRSNISPDRFLVLPTSYIIGRQEADADNRKFKPCLLLFSTINMVDNTSKWVMDASLVPDLTVAERMEILLALKSQTAYEPKIEYITEIPNQTCQALLSIDSMESVHVTMVPTGFALHLTIEANIESILILLNMLKRNALGGQLDITLADGNLFRTALVPQLNRIAGTWQYGHLYPALTEAGKASLENISETNLLIEKYRLYKNDDGSFIEQDWTQPVEAGQSVDMPLVPAATESFVPYYSLVNPAEVTIEQINQYLEDVKCQVIFVCTIDLSASGIKSIELSCRLKGTIDSFPISLQTNALTRELFLLMPITNFMVERIVEYRVEKIVKADNTELPGQQGYSEQDLSTERNIINITSATIHQP